MTNKEQETCVIAGAGAAASFAETENGRELRTETRPERGCPGWWRPTQRGPNPRQHWRFGQKKSQPIRVGILGIGGAGGN